MSERAARGRAQRRHARQLCAGAPTVGGERRRTRRFRGGAWIALLALVPWGATPAWAAFAAGVQTSGTSVVSYVVPVPGGIHCVGLSSPASSTINWNAVTPPPGDTIVYVVTVPAGGTTTQAATSFQLPPVTLTSGQYKVQVRIASGWLSQPATITVGLTVLGLLYTCSTP